MIWQQEIQWPRCDVLRCKRPARVVLMHHLTAHGTYCRPCAHERARDMELEVAARGRARRSRWSRIFGRWSST